MVPGLEIYYQAFSNRQVGVASALAVVLMVLVLVCILPIQWLTRDRAR
jgi:raffinose/stachyose/melibiose transport system permease protein